MKIVKELEHAILLRHFNSDNQDYLSVTTMLYVDLLEPKLSTEQQLWREVTSFLREDEPLDVGMPKQNAEFLAYGSCFSQEPTTAKEVGIKVGTLEKKLYVTGDRHYEKNALGLISKSEATPFTRMPVGFTRAYGGAEYAKNPIGTGYFKKEALKDARIKVPNIESYAEVVASHSEVLAPQSFEPMNISWEDRIKKAGTYDNEWLRTRWPYFPSDMDYTIFNTALPDQTQQGSFRGDEQVIIENMNETHRRIEAFLPNKKIKTFLTRASRKDLYSEEVLKEEFFEVENKIDTVILFTDIAKAVVVYRAVVKVVDDEYSDIVRGFFVTEEANSPQRDSEYYRQLEATKIDRAVDIDESKFAEHEAKMAKTAKSLADMPLKFEQKLKELKGEAPRVSPSPKTSLDHGIKLFEQMESTFQNIGDNGIMQMVVDKAPQHEELLRKSDLVKSLDEKFRKSFGKVAADLKANPPATKLSTLYTLPQKLLDSAKEIESKIPEFPAHLPTDDAKMVKKLIDENKFSVKLENMMQDGDNPMDALMIKSWSDGAKYFVGDHKLFLNNFSLQCAELEDYGLRETTLDISNISYNDKDLIINARHWKQDEPIEINEGFILPYFDKDELKKLIIRPRLFDDEKRFIGDKDDIEIDGSGECDLIIYGRNKEVVVVVDEYLQAWLMHQELWDVCTVALFKDEETLMASELYKDEALKQIITTRFDISNKKEELQCSKISLEKSILEEYPKRDFRKEVIDLLEEGEFKSRLLKEERKKARMGLFYQPDFDVDAHQKEMSDFMTKKVHGKLDKSRAEMEARLAKQREEAPPHMKKAFAQLDKKRGEKVKEPEQPTSKNPAQVFKDEHKKQKKRLLKMGVDPKIIARLDKEAEVFDSPEFERLGNLKEELKEAHAPMRALEEKGVLPDWAKRQFKNAFGRDMGAESLKFKTAQEVLSHHAQEKSFANADLKGLELEDLDLSGADFSQANMTGVSLKGTKLDRANLSDTKLMGADLERTSFVGADLKKTNLMGANVEQTSFREADLSGAIIKSVEFLNSDLEKANFDNCIFSGSSIKNCSAVGSSFESAVMDKGELEDSDFSNASMFKAIVNRSSIKRCEFFKAKLSKITLVATDMEDLSIQSADLHNITLVKESTMTRVTLKGSDVSKSYFDRIKIEECDFDGCNSSQVYMNKCKIKESSFRGVSAERMRIERTYFENCDLSGGDYMYGSFRKTFFNHVDLSRSNLFSADLFKLKVNELNLDNANLKMTMLAGGKEKLIQKNGLA